MTETNMANGVVVSATLNMVGTHQADPRSYIEDHFPAIRNAAIALEDAGFSYRQMAKLLQISKKAVWMHLTTNCNLRSSVRLDLTIDELLAFEEWLGERAYHDSIGGAHDCPDCRSETHLCRIHQKRQILIERYYERGSREWYLTMHRAGIE